MQCASSIIYFVNSQVDKTILQNCFVPEVYHILNSEVNQLLNCVLFQQHICILKCINIMPATYCMCQLGVRWNKLREFAGKQNCQQHRAPLFSRRLAISCLGKTYFFQNFNKYLYQAATIQSAITKTTGHFMSWNKIEISICPLSKIYLSCSTIKSAIIHTLGAKLGTTWDEL